MRLAIATLFISVCLVWVVQADPVDLPPGVKNTQNPKDVPPSPEEAARRFKPTEGFHVNLFAGDPAVNQPISMALDDRGRLWVAECFSYPAWTDDPRKGQDRILIFEDTDGDGRFDRRTVFWDRAWNLTSLAIGQGGVWALCSPHLLFIPDRNGDDAPDGPPQIILDGWTLKSGHNMVNGLMWGPDGWLYGRHGITAESQVGRPGALPTERVRMNCGIWRYHPAKKIFEVVAHGTTNPWGMDFDDHGEAFFTNCVIGHLWHLVPGAHYKRMYGLDYNPFAYELIESTSDHLHWGGGHWTTSRGGQGIHSHAGGGHAHTGGMIYLGDNWPDALRNQIFMCNIHGNRINRDLLERKGNSYVGRHLPDFLLSDNLWFRGLELIYGPDGGVYLSDWCDLGECHDHDGVHKSSGRIYKISHGKPTFPGKLNLAKKTNAELVALQLHKNDWYVRHARRILAERARAGQDMTGVHPALKKMFDQNPEPARKLRAMWALYVTGGTSPEWLEKQLFHADEHVRCWAIRLLCDWGDPGPGVREKFVLLAEKDPSGLVRLYLASTLQRLPLADRLAVARKLAGHGEDASDRCQPLMIWYGIEPAVCKDQAGYLGLASTSRIPKIRRFIARRLTEAAGDDAASLEPLMTALFQEKEAMVQEDLLEGIQQGIRGRKKLAMPAGWKTAYPRLAASPRFEVRRSAHILGLVFGDARARDNLGRILNDRKAPVPERTASLQALVSHGVPDLLPTLLKLLDDGKLRGPVLRALAAYPDDGVPPQILTLYPRLTHEEKQDAIATLCSRPMYALALLDAMEKNRVPRNDLSAFSARQLQDLRDKKVTEKLARVWGQVRQTPKEKKAAIAKYKARLTTDILAGANRANGRLIFNRTCFQCHTLFGEGNKIGPDLTGSNRFDLHYLLENLIDPSAVIGRDYQLTNIYTRTGRLVSGIIVEETERALTVQTASERLVMAKADIEERRLSPVSMMPEGQVEQLSFNELRDLIGYLKSMDQVPLPNKDKK